MADTIENQATADFGGRDDDRTWTSGTVRTRREFDDEIAPGRTVGAYRIVEALGVGGFGAVFLAEQTAPVVRPVALKVLKLGMDSDAVLARFEAERQALAIMDHPGIARVYDAGTTPRGRPYFCMEYVRGKPVTTFAATSKLTTAQRLAMFIDICRAVQHAHHKGVIHRDLKPSNILVELVDERPVPRVIDFGIAKAVRPAETGEAGLTIEHQMIGTPAYMSPEQAENSPGGVDTRTDIYALGVILYELLTGSPPLTYETLSGTRPEDLTRVIREFSPPKPSARVRTSGPRSAELEREFRVTPVQLEKLLRNDLDWIVLKALEKDRERRYSSASELAADIERYLAGEAVLASPPSAVYRLRKAVLRHRGVIAAAGAVALALLAGTGLATAGFISASRQRDVAVAAQAESDARRLEAEASLGFLARTLRSADPGQSGRNVTVREVMDDARLRIAGEFDGDPRVLARLQQTIGEVYVGLGELDRAGPLLEGAGTALEAELGAGHPATVSATVSRAGLLREQGRFDEARAVLAPIVAADGDVLPADLRAEAAYTLARVAAATASLDEARALLEEAIAAQTAALGAAHARTLASRREMALLMLRSGALAEAEAEHRATVAAQSAALGPDHPDTLASRADLAVAVKEQGRAGEAVTMLEELIADSTRVLGAEHPATLERRARLGQALLAAGRHEEAAGTLADVVARRAETLGREHPNTLNARSVLALALGNLGDKAGAAAMLREVLDAQVRTLGLSNETTLATAINLAGVARELKDFDGAEHALATALLVQEEVYGPTHPRSIAARISLAQLVQDRKDLPRAAAMYRDAAGAAEAAHGPAHPTRLVALANLAAVERALGNAESAEAIYKEAIGLLSETAGADAPDTLQTRVNFAVMLNQQKRFDEAQLVLDDVLRRAVEARGAGDRSAADAARALGRTAAGLAGLGRHLDAAEIMRRALRAHDAAGRELESVAVTAALRLAEYLAAAGEEPAAAEATRDLYRRTGTRAAAEGATAEDLNEHAWLLLTGPVAGLRDPGAALALAERAADASGHKDAMILDTLARAHFDTGDAASAVTVAEAALAIAEDESVKDDLRKALAEYRGRAEASEP